MQWVLPGGAVLGGSIREGAEREVACRRLAGVETSRTFPKLQPVSPADEPRPAQAEDRPPVELAPARVDAPPPPPVVPDSPPPKVGERLATVKLVLEVLAVLVGLIGAILALFGVSRK